MAKLSARWELLALGWELPGVWWALLGLRMRDRDLMRKLLASMWVADRNGGRYQVG
ncbi:MAG: hypothetical protein ACPGLY_08875 [Rubripirellula sp.]